MALRQGVSILLLALGVLIASCPSTVSAREVVDGVGRKLVVPDTISRVYVTSPVAVVMLYTLAPEKMIGWNYQLGPVERRYVLPSVRELPALGGWFGENGKGNRETLIAARPDLILSVGTADGTAVDFAERLQKQVGIPVWVASGSLAATADTYERLGALLGVPERAAELASYARRVLSETQAFVAALPATAHVKIYYAEGLRGLQTDMKGSMHTEVIDALGLVNVADVDSSSNYGRAPVSLDQVIAWNPDVIIACPEKLQDGKPWFPEWVNEGAWRQVGAVKRGHVVLIPGAPFNWLDRPPSAARLLGLRWLAWSLWPERVGFDMVVETREFYRLFYHYEMTEAEARALLSASHPILTEVGHDR